MTGIKTVGVVGAGQMGNGIAHVMALGGFDVILSDIDRERIKAAIALIDKNLARQVGKEKITAADAEKALSRIKTGTDLSVLKNCDLVIESASENLEVKKAIFKELSGLLRDDAIMASNTSSISITRLASGTDRPEKFMGFHFMNPVPVMQLVELIRGIATDAETFEACHEVVRRLGKTAASAEDFPGFIVNRILMPMINEAVYTLYEGIGNVTSIDTSMKLGTNHPMGALGACRFHRA